MRAFLDSLAGRIFILIILMLMILSMMTGFWIGRDKHIADFSFWSCNKNYFLLHPDYRCNNKSPFKGEFEDLENSLEKWAAEQEQKNIITHLSVYFRDLDNGPWFGVEEKEVFSAASLLKVPVMIAVLKQAEIHPGFLNETLSYTGKMDVLRNVPEEQSLLPDTPYTIDELLTKMIVYSDNYSMELLKARLGTLEKDRDLLSETYRELGFVWGEGDTIERPMTVKSYASVLRLLYNGTYLSKEYSQKALSLLTQTTFMDGLRAGLPPGIVVASKFGVRGNNEEFKQLHECGIVYLPGNPYLLCVMTRGTNMEANAEAIAAVTKMVHAAVLERMSPSNN